MIFYRNDKSFGKEEKQMSLTSEVVRRTFKASDDKRDKGLKTPEDIERFDDIVYGENEKWNLLDVYRPKKEAGKKLPVIVSVHGGGWVYGTKETYQFYCMNLAERGFAVVNFSYRLAPEYKFPAPLEDTNKVISWILDHKKEYQFDTEHIYMVGDSAGGNTLALYAAICTNPEYAKNFAFKVPDHFKPKAIALNCGTYNQEMEKGEQKKGLMADYLPEKGTREELDLINPMLHLDENYPPVFLMTATGDFLIDQATMMAGTLTKHKVPFLYRFYGDAKTELGHVFHCNIRVKEAGICNDEECEFFRKY